MHQEHLQSICSYIGHQELTTDYNQIQGEKLVLTFLERRRMEGLMSRCGTRDSEGTVVMEGMDAAAGHHRDRCNQAAIEENQALKRSAGD